MINRYVLIHEENHHKNFKTIKVKFKFINIFEVKSFHMCRNSKDSFVTVDHVDETAIMSCKLQKK